MNNKIVSLLNTQFQKELESAYLYLYFASALEAEGLTGFANWFKKQAREEEDHAMRFYDYLHEKNEAVRFADIAIPSGHTDSVLNILKDSLEHEEYVTGLIYYIYRISEEENDYSTQNFLNWFVCEQREEEAQVHRLIDVYNMLGGTSQGLYTMDKELLCRK